jgi:hypothetical protein
MPIGKRNGIARILLTKHHSIQAASFCALDFARFLAIALSTEHQCICDACKCVHMDVSLLALHLRQALVHDIHRAQQMQKRMRRLPYPAAYPAAG